MPIYEYHCTACGKHCEILQKVYEPAETICPSCAAPNLEKLVSAPSFQLKGTGWYVTDFRDKGKKPATTTEDTAKTTDSAKAADSPKDTDKATPAAKKEE